MNCPYCGTRNRGRAEFCRHCRALLPRSAEPSRRRAITDVRGPAALVLLVVALVVGGFLFRRQVVTLIGAPAAVATIPSTPPASRRQQVPPATRSPMPTATAQPTAPPPLPTSTPHTGTPVAGAAVLPPPSPTGSPARRQRRRALAQVHSAPSATARPAPPPATAAPTPRPLHTVTVHRARGRPRSAAAIAADEARVSAAVVASNVAWTRALETASPLGLDQIKTGANLRSILSEVALLREHDEYWRIDVQQVRVIWARLLGPTRAQALVRKIGEARRLYRHGQATPLEVDRASYSNLCDLDLVGGRWLVSRVAALDDATAARLAAAPPTGYQTS